MFSTAGLGSLPNILMLSVALIGFRLLF